MTEQKPKKVRLSIDMDEKTHKDLKYIALIRNTTMRKLVLRALVAFIKYERNFN